VNAAVRPRKFAHVVYRTRRFAEMLKWYGTVFDAKVQFESPVIAFLTYDEEHHRMAFLNLDAIAPRTEGAAPGRRQGEIGVDHVAYTYGCLRDLVENYARLKDAGILPYWCIHHGVTVSMYYGDPDGNQMEMQVDSYPTVEDANGFMYGPSFATNPIGLEYDPDELLRRLRSGEPEASFLHRASDLPVSPIRSAAGTWA
jgi:catechol-2,3-dioxygenase